MRAFILAGGFATRLWPLTEKRAKPLLPLAGKPILTRLVEKIPEDISITVSTNAVFREGFEEWKKSINRDIRILIEDTHKDDHKLGALGAVRQWIVEEHIDENVLLLTGDNYCGFSLKEFVGRSHGTPLLAAYDIGKLSAASAYGTVILGNDGETIQSFEEKPQNPRSTLVSTGCSILPRATLPILVEYAKHHPDNVGGIFEELLRRDLRVECFTFKEPWFDIGSFQAYLEATRALVGDRVLHERGARCEGTRCEGSCVIGKNSIVRESHLRNVVLFEHCNVSDCVLEDCILDRNCRLKGVDLSGKMLREGTVLEVT